MTKLDPRRADLDEAIRLEAAGEYAAAVETLRRDLAPEPSCFEAWLTLSRLLHRTDQTSEAVRTLRQAEGFDPLAGEFRQVQLCIQARSFARAREIAQSMLEAVPGHPRAVFTLAHLAQSRGDFEAAVEILETGLALVPANPVLQSLLIGALEQTGAYARALEAARALVALEETQATLWTLISAALRYGANALALKTCDRALRVCATDSRRLAAVQLVRGQCLRVLGQREEAVKALHAALSADPASGAAWWALADLKTHAFSDEDVETMRRLVERPGLPSGERSSAAFALARALEMRSDPGAAFDAYAKANSLHPGGGFDPQAFRAAARKLAQAFSPDALSTRAPTKDGPRPVFIVGLPRSGSTLVEQILASHPEIEGTIEQPTLPAVKRKAHRICAQRYGGGYLENVDRLTPEDLGALGAAYLDESQLFRSRSSAIFTDKLPHNFEHVGLIHKILPKAVIVDVRRNPMDCGYSLFKQHFAEGVGFSYDLEHIAAYYNGYLEIMDHWDRVLPGKVLTVQYEELVQDPEAAVRVLLGHVGVAFDPACLEFHKTRRPVRTASSEQVRRPMNRDGVGAWRTVEDRLAPLRKALGAETLDRFADYL